MEFDFKLEPTLNPITCVGENNKCETCRIGPNGSGHCPGCNGHCGMKGKSNMWKCSRMCMTCGGGIAAPNSVPAICCKSPLADLFIDKVEPGIGRGAYQWKKRPVISLKQHGIIVTQGGVGKTKDPYPRETACVAVNLRHVWSGNGWYSRDMKDYLRIPREANLLLLTMTHDDVLERAWDKELHEEDWGAVGFDFWQPLHFSLYEADSKMNAYWQWRRIMHATERGAGWFAPYVPQLLSRKVDAEILEMSKSIPQVILNAQFLGTDKDVEWFLRSLVRDHNLFPKSVPFWFVGPSTRKMVRLLKSFLRGREVYILSTAPWLAGHKGTEFVVTGQTRKSKLSKDELILQNQRVFMDMVEGS